MCFFFDEENKRNAGNFHRPIGRKGACRGMEVLGGCERDSNHLQFLISKRDPMVCEPSADTSGRHGDVRVQLLACKLLRLVTLNRGGCWYAIRFIPCCR